MNIPAAVKPAAWGAVGGAIALAVIGFAWGGWVTGGSAERAASARETAAVIEALAPVCAARFKREPDAETRMAELKKTSSWQRESLVEKGGWATFAGHDKPYPGLARACAELLSA